MAYTPTTVWTNGQALTHTALNAEFTAIAADSAAKPGADIVDGSVTTAKLANARGYFTVTIPLIAEADALGAGALATAVPGLGNNLNTQNFSIPFAVNCTIVDFAIFCNATTAAGGTRANAVRIWLNGVAQGTGVTGFTAATLVSHGTVAWAVTASQTNQVRCQTDTGANDGVTAPYIVLHCLATHAV